MIRFILVASIFGVTTEGISQQNLQKYQFSNPAMGTTFALTFYANSNEEANHIASLAFERIEELNLVFSDYTDESEASQLTEKAGQRVTVSDDLWYLLKVSRGISKASKGAFDVTIGPLSKLWRRAIRQQEFPDSVKILEAKALVNYKWIKLYPTTKQVKIKKPGMKLDFGGIAKGYAIDQAFQVLYENGIEIALVDGGGDLFVYGIPPDKANWEVKNHQGEPLILDPPEGIASSGDSYQYLKWKGGRYSHIVRPSSGLGLKDSEVVTVSADNATIADAMASTVSLVSEKHQKKLLKKYKARIIK